MGDSILCKSCLSPAMDGAGTRRLRNHRWRSRLMKKFLLGTVALVALGATVPAFAADLGARTYTKAPAYAAPIYNSTGFYIGGLNRARVPFNKHATRHDFRVRNSRHEA